MKRVVRLPDVGEGVAEAELVAWHVAVGDEVTPDSVVAEVLTDKATVEIYAPTAGRIDALHGTAGDVLAVGGDFFVIEAVDAGVVAEDRVSAGPTATVIGENPTVAEPPATAVVTPPADVAVEPEPATERTSSAAASGLKPTAAPAVRERARQLGVDLGAVPGTGPDGHVTHGDLDRYLKVSAGGPSRGVDAVPTATTAVPIIGLRRRIAERLTVASRIPHITYVDEVDMTQLEQLRAALSAGHPNGPRLTVLPFVMAAIVRAVADQPQLNATYDDTANVLTQYASVHIGIATQTPNGLVVPVVRHVETRDIWAAAAEMARVTAAAREGTAKRDELSGSTITITSLGALGGLVTTPIINHPEVAIIGVNKMQMRPVWNGQEFVPRRMMNLSSSFDHRIVDGWDAATFIQRIKALLEEPALLFIPEPVQPVGESGNE